MPFITLGMVPHFRVKIRSKQKGKSSVFENDVRHRGRNVKTPLHTAERTRKDLQSERLSDRVQHLAHTVHPRKGILSPISP